MEEILQIFQRERFSDLENIWTAPSYKYKNRNRNITFQNFKIKLIHVSTGRGGEEGREKKERRKTTTLLNFSIFQAYPSRQTFA